MPATYVMMGGAFENVNGTGIKLKDINFGSDFAGPEWDEDSSVWNKVAPQIQLANLESEGTVWYYYLDGAVDDGKGGYKAGWVDENGDEPESDPIVEPGLGFWYRDYYNKNREFNNCGQIVPDSPWEKTFNVTYRMLVCPFPIDVSLKDINFINLEKNIPEWDEDGDFKKTATQVQVPNRTTEGFLSYFYVDHGVEDPKNPGEYIAGWVNEDGDTPEDSDLVIPAGRGAWFRPLVGGDPMTVEFYINGKPKAE